MNDELNLQQELNLQRNIYANPPASIDEQIKILQSRGMLIDDYVLAKEFLEEVYFHRFLSYSVPFFNNFNNKNYKANTHFQDVVRVYDFDSKLRLLILDAIEKIEISVRTQFIQLSWKYGPHFYLNHKLFRDHKLLNDSIERIEYQIKSSHDLLVNEYYHRYYEPEMPPVWIAIELTSIGQLSKWLMNLKRDEDKATIAKRYKIDYSVLQAILDNLTQLRNYAAHHTRIWNRHYHFECESENNQANINHALKANGKIYTVLSLITYVLTSLRQEKTFYNQLLNLINNYKIDTHTMGFPVDWQHHFYDIMHGALYEQ